MAEFASFRNQAEAKSPWSLDEDSRKGFSQSVNNNQPQMALYYVQEIIKEYDVSISLLNEKIRSLEANSEIKPIPRTATAKKVTDQVEA